MSRNFVQQNPPHTHGDTFGLFRKKSSACPNCTFFALCKIALKQIAELRAAICSFKIFTRNDFEKSNARPHFLRKTHVRGRGDFPVSFIFVLYPAHKLNFFHIFHLHSFYLHQIWAQNFFIQITINFRNIWIWF